MTSATKGWGYEFVTNVHYSYGNYLMSMVKRIIDFIFTCLDFFFQFLGQKLVEWHQLDVSSFLDQVTGFLGEHGQLDGLSSSPPKKCARSVSISDG